MTRSTKLAIGLVFSCIVMGGVLIVVTYNNTPEMHVVNGYIDNTGLTLYPSGALLIEGEDSTVELKIKSSDEVVGSLTPGTCLINTSQDIAFVPGMITGDRLAELYVNDGFASLEELGIGHRMAADCLAPPAITVTSTITTTVPAP